MTNSQAATHESWLVRCSPHAPGFSRSNQHGFKFSHSSSWPAIHNVSSSRATVCQGSTLLQFCYKIQQKPNQSTWYQPWAVTHLSPLSGHPIPTLFTDPPVTIWPSSKVACSFGNYLHPRPNLLHVHVTSALS